MISSPVKAPRWPRRAFLRARVTAAESRETATCLIREKRKDTSEQRRWHFPEKSTCTFSSTGSYSYITFAPHQSHFACALAARFCELFISLFFFFWVCLCEPYLFFPPPQCNTFFIYIENITSWQPNLNSALFSYCLRMFNMQGCLTVTQLSKNISIYK